MKYYSTTLNRLFETEKELHEAEKKYEEKQKEAEVKKAERAKKAKAVEDAYKLAELQRKAADDLLEEFVKEYGSYHKTVTKPSTEEFSVFDILSKFPFWF